MRRLSELLHSTVFDAAGEELGSVDDVRLVQDGPLLDGVEAALRIEGLVVGRGSISVRLGFHRQKVTGPWLLAKIFGALERRAAFVPWGEVDRWEGDRVVLRGRASDLPTVAEVY
jgi:hypothetical protein